MKKHSKTLVLAAAFTLAVLALGGMPAYAGGGNPLDSVGVEHNVYLGCLMRAGSDPNVPLLQRVVEECGFDPGTSTEEFVATYSPLVEADSDQTVVERMSPYREIYTSYQFSYFTRIDQVIAKAQSAAAADAMFAQLEAEAIARLTTRTVAEQSIFAALSTARHSLQYWTQTTGITGVAVQKGKPGGKLGQKLGKLGKFWQVLIVVGADLAGVAGTLALTGGTGAAAAGVVGAACSGGAADVLTHNP